MRKQTLTVIGILLAAILLIALPILVYAGTLGNALLGIRQDKVVLELPSPDGSKIVQVIESDQGALGGATLVQVRETPDTFLFFTAVKDSVKIYEGKYAEHKTIQVSWKDDSCLLINGREYPIG